MRGRPFEGSFRQASPNSTSRRNAIYKSDCGRLTLAAFCEQEDLDLKAVSELLSEQGYVPGSDKTLRDIAFEAGARPPQIMQLLTAQSK